MSRHKGLILAHPLGWDVHTAGLVSVISIAQELDYEPIFIPPSDSLDELLQTVAMYKPQAEEIFLALSYRRSPDRGQEFVDEAVARLKENRLFRRDDDTLKILFGGLEETCERVHARHPYIDVFPQSGDQKEDIIRVVDYFGLRGDDAHAYANKRIAEVGDDPSLAQLADDIISSGRYWEHERVGVPSLAAQSSLVTRMREDRERGLMTLRTHFGIPNPYRPDPTIEGIKQIALLELIGIISLGCSDRTQRAKNFGHPERWLDGKDDGGVVIRNIEDMIALYEATRRGNFPAIKPYCGTDNMKTFNEAALEYLHLDEAFQAIPIPGEWFGLLDDRGPLTPEEAVIAHMELVGFLAEKGVPIEANNPHHYALRYGHDALVVAAHGMAAAAANKCGVKDYIIQLMFNTPPISSWGDYARMSASLDLARQIRGNKTIHVETRAGLMYFRPNPEIARRQLATTTLLQMYVDPMLMHVVNYCEADHAATVEDVEESALIALQAISDFKTHRGELPDFENDQRVINRKEVLFKEAKLLLTAIASLGGYQGNDVVADGKCEEYLPRADVIDRALELGLLAAPGITYAPYPKASKIFTAVKDGCLYVVESPFKEGVDIIVLPTVPTLKIIPEAERISRILQ